jgi:flagellar motor switch protein FliG
MLVLEDLMGNGRSLVVTAYGHSKTIDKISVSSFEFSESSYYSNHESDAKTYCNTINSLELKSDSWIFARILSENTQYSLGAFFPLKFSNIITKLGNWSLQRILRETDLQELAKSLKDQDEAVKEKIFTNMSKETSKILKKDMEFIGATRIEDVEECQEKIVSIILRMNRNIIIPNYI